MKQLQQLAQQAGFQDCFVLPPEKFIHYERRLLDGALHENGLHLVYDPAEQLPWANALLLLLLPYRPYAPACGVSGNYPSSNQAYHAANKMLENLRDAGIRGERVYVPIRELALRSGIGIACDNGLTAYDGYGTRAAVQTLAAEIPDVEYEPMRPERTCSHCGQCAAVCPGGAITERGFDYHRCMRAYMEKQAMPDWVMDAMDSILGCEICQFACPLNAQVAPLETVPDAFELEKLIRGETKPALALVGANLNAGGRLIAHAIVLATHQNRVDLLPLIRPYAEDARPAVASAAKYAICRLQETQF